MGGGSLGRVAGTGGARPGDAVMSGTSLPFSYNKLRQKLIIGECKNSLKVIFDYQDPKISK